MHQICDWVKSPSRNYFLTIFKNFSWSWQIFPNHEAASEDAYKNENFFVFRLKILNYFRPGNF